MDSRIIQGRLEDVDVISQLFNEYRQFYGQADDLPLARSFIAERLSDNSSIIFLAVDSHDLGLGFVQLYLGFSSISTKPVLNLNDLYVTKHARCVGLGVKLMKLVIQYARDHDISKLVLETQEANQPARSLYTSLGFEVDNDFLTYSLDIKRQLK